MLVRKISAVALGLIVSMPAASNGGTIRDDVLGAYTTYDSAVLNAAGSDQYPAVGRLTSTAFLCSGTLIAPNWVVTAAHCVDSGSAKNMTFRVNGTSYTGATMLANPSWTGNLGAGNDIGLLKLQSNVSGVTPATRTSLKPLQGTTGVAVGFGRTGNGATGATGSAGTKHAGPLVIDQYGDASGFNWNERILLTDFDNPTKATDSTMGSTSPLDLEYDTASGDSGGALIVTDLSGNKLLAGVVSLGWAYDGNVNSDYGDGSGFTSIADFNTWIDSVINGSSGGSTGGGGKGKPRSVNIMSQEAGSVIAMTQMAVVPEPNSIVLLGLGMAGILSQRRRK